MCGSACVPGNRASTTCEQTHAFVRTELTTMTALGTCYACST
jgi:hypothetical protein